MWMWRAASMPPVSLSRDLAEAAGLIVEHGLADLAGRVHDERTVADDRLVERLAGDEQELGAFVRRDRDLVAVAAEDDGVVLARHTIAARRFAADEKREGVVRVRHGLREARARGETDVEVDDGRAGVDARVDAEGFAGDDGDDDLAVGARGGRDLGRAQLLVARLHHLVAPWQVDPELESVQPPAGAQDLRRRHLGVNDAGAGSHPLHVARIDAAAIALRVLVLDRAVEDVGAGLEAAMRMVGRPMRLPRPMGDGPHAVEEEKGIEVVEPRRRKRPRDDHPLAFELASGVDDVGNGARGHAHVTTKRYSERATLRDVSQLVIASCHSSSQRCSGGWDLPDWRARPPEAASPSLR